MVFSSRAAYSGRLHFKLAICPDTRTGCREEYVEDGEVRRCRTSITEWHIMSFKTPPPCKSPRQNQGLCGPLCSSAALARYGRPVKGTPRVQMISRAVATDGANS